MSSACVCCQKSKAPIECGLCHGFVCKNCVQFCEPEGFSFYKVMPEAMSKGRYCGPCFEEKVSPEIQKYHQTMRLARQVNVFTKIQTKETRLVKRTEKPIRVECWDREEALLRLGFEAARAGFNGLIDVEVIYEKVRDHAYQTTRWIGVGTPAHLNPDRPGWD